MASASFPIIAKQGWWVVAVLVGLTILAFIYELVHWQLVTIALLLVWLYLFRDPNREIPASPLAIVSPADGEVTRVVARKDPCLAAQCICISVRMRLLSVYTIRSPVEGRVQKRWFSPADSDGIDASKRQSKRARYFGAWLQTDEEDDVMVILKSKSRWQKLNCFVYAGDRVGQGQRCGFVQFGATVDIYVPENAIVRAEPGDKVLAGSDIIATIVHR